MNICILTGKVIRIKIVCNDNTTNAMMRRVGC